MNAFFLSCFFVITCIELCLADCDNLQDYCPSDTVSKHRVFMNGLPCKNPADVAASDFKSSMLNRPGDTDNFVRSSTNLVTAAEFPGLNTLGLAIARTDLDVDGIVMPHSHPRASEVLFVSKGVVITGFIDTKSQLFQRTLNKGDLFVFPRGLLHFCLNAGSEVATVFSVLNSQNPGLVEIADAMFGPDPSNSDMIARKIKSLSGREGDELGNVTLGISH